MTSLFTKTSVREASEYFRRPGPSIPQAMRVTTPARPASMSLLVPPKILRRTTAGTPLRPAVGHS